MASESAPAPVNGNYAPQHTYGSGDQNYAGQHATTSSGTYTGTASASSTQPSTSNSASEIPKDEVGWYFVEQYYTTLSRSPEKLYLFYNKRSQFVYGVEEEKVSVCMGLKAINEKIKDLNFQDCKVRVTNVDSQGSDQNIVIQVIGEISNNHQPRRKFVQTFVLAGQTNGYFVLNDIFRYIQEEEEELEGEEAQESAAEPATTEAAPAATESPSVEATQPTETEDAKPEKVAEKTQESTPASADVNGTQATESPEVTQAEDAPVAAPETAPTATESVEAPSAEEAVQVETPKESTPTPPVAAQKPAAPAVPASTGPKSWAKLAAAGAAAANRVATPNVPAPAAAAPAAPAQAKAPSTTPSQPAAPAAAAPAAAAPAREASPSNSQGESGWQTAGHDHSKRQSRIQGQPPVAEPQNTRAYIKNVYESLDADALKAALAKHGEIAYFDVSRPKNCAFVDFATASGFQAAVSANPHHIGDDSIYVEERRTRPAGSFGGGFQRGGMRGGRGDGPRQGGQGRGGFKQDGGRGGFNPRGRGGNVAPRGRGN